MDSPALSSGAVALKPCIRIDAARRAAAVLAAQQGVVAERLLLAHFAGGLHRLRGADAASCHFVAQPTSTFTPCRKNKSIPRFIYLSTYLLWRKIRDSKWHFSSSKRAPYMPLIFTHVCSREIHRIPWHILCTVAR